MPVASHRFAAASLADTSDALGEVSPTPADPVQHHQQRRGSQAGLAGRLKVISQRQIAISAKFVPLLLSLLPGVGVVALATAGVTVVYIYTDSIRELNVQAARQGVELNVGLVTTRLAVPPDEPLFLPLPEYELTDAFQNRIPVALPLPSFPLPEAPPTLPGTIILDPKDSSIGTSPFGEGVDLIGIMALRLVPRFSGQDTSSNRGIKAKRLRTGWDNPDLS
ncbi:hypothetical protein L1047_09345 [Synechococcus sp. Nb3U1]|uniref:hypothetical protein n=1 Tax=Synechococcus sp. Nb3U1 TaxID=1914529 RepID=UPI001F3C41D9|nr:hypothetical protein [Synechococcus sp. Nb3U1]MCF2971396.1 hypothetical protein [Synechococcus sp. Nb3U1]